MTLDRILAAIQRTSHLTNYQMRCQYAEIYQIRWQMRLEEIGANTTKAARHILTEN